MSKQVNSAAEKRFRQLVVLGEGYLQSGKYSVALPFFQRAVVLRPNGAMAHHGIGLCLQALGRFEEASKCHYLAGILDSKEPSFPMAASQCYWARGYARLAQRAIHEACRRMSPGTPPSLTNRITLLRDQLDRLNEG